MKEILVLGGGASGLAAAIAAAQAGGSRVRVTLLEQNPAPGKKLLATGNGRCNFDNLASGEPERYFTASPQALAGLLAAIDAAGLPAWWEGLGLVHRADETGRLYPYSNQASDLTGLLVGWLDALGVSVRTGCRVMGMGQKGRGYAVQVEQEDRRTLLVADKVICALGGSAGPQFGTGGFGPAMARRAGGRVEPLYPCLTPLRCKETEQLKPLAGLRARGAVTLWEGGSALAREEGEIQFTDYGLSGICVMQLSGLLAPGRGPQEPAVTVDLFPAWTEEDLAALLEQRGKRLAAFPGCWQGMLDRRLGDALWAAAGLSGRKPAQLGPEDWRKLAHTCKAWRFSGLSLCGWKQAQTTGGGLSLEEVEPDFQFKGCRGLYFVGETLDCAGSCGGFNLHWAFGSGVVAGRAAATTR